MTGSTSDDRQHALQDVTRWLRAAGAFGVGFSLLAGGIWGVQAGLWGLVGAGLSLANLWALVRVADRVVFGGRSGFLLGLFLKGVGALGAMALCAWWLRDSGSSLWGFAAGLSGSVLASVLSPLWATHAVATPEGVAQEVAS